jgi:hypothetical protein
MIKFSNIFRRLKRAVVIFFQERHGGVKICQSEGTEKVKKRLVSWKEQRPLELEPASTNIDHIVILTVKQISCLQEHIQDLYYNINIYLTEIVWGYIDWIDFALDRDIDMVNMIMHLCLPCKAENFLRSISSMEFVLKTKPSKIILAQCGLHEL